MSNPSESPFVNHYGAFVCNPGTYDGLSAVAVLQEINWTIDRGSPQIGDKAIIWKAKGNGHERGVIALAEVIEPPTMRPEQKIELPFWRMRPKGKALRCRLRILPTLNVPLWESQHEDILSTLAVARSRGGTTFTLKPAQWDAIAVRAGVLPEHSERTRRQSQGFMTNPKLSRAVEQFAERKAEEHFSKLGFKVRNVGKYESYDLLCHRSEDEVRVEVKGTTGTGDSVLLTQNEVEHARENRVRMALVVVSQIVLTDDAEGIRATGGKVKVLWPWNIDNGILKPIQFQYRPG